MRHPLAFVAVSAAAAGYLLRSEAQRRLSKLRGRRKEDHPIHQGASGAVR
jgi:hypothetical protein